MSQNYPNPFNPSTTIEYTLPAASQVELTIYDILGQRVATLVDGHRPAGTHQVTWDGRSDGVPVASGVYLYRMDSPGGDGSWARVRRMLLLR